MQNADHQSFEILRSRSKGKTFQARLSRNSLEVLVMIVLLFFACFNLFCAVVGGSMEEAIGFSEVCSTI